MSAATIDCAADRQIVRDTEGEAKDFMDALERKKSSFPNSGIIQILSDEVVQQIAAGEVVQRASSAIKELLENSIDAQADTIRVSVHSSGHSFSVVDNGTGFAKADFSLACTRHATSKIRKYQDLRSISSFGFRGEALAALSMVSNVTITSRTAAADTACAYQMQYSNGQPNTEDPTPMARTVGTTIQVTDLFYNLPHRQVSKKSSVSTEYLSILKVLQSYAIHHAEQGIAISCQKVGSNTADVNTAPFVAAVQKALHTSSQRHQKKSEIHLGDLDQEDEAFRAMQETATKNVIGLTSGSHLIPFLLSHSSCLQRDKRYIEQVVAVRTDHTNPFEDTDDEKKEDSSTSSRSEMVTDSNMVDASTKESLVYSCTGYITSPSYFQSDSKKLKGIQHSGSVILFINHRFIEGCSALRRSIEDVYVKFCKQKPPFLYLSILVPPDTIDVNVHPTKREVVLLHMDEIRTHLAQHIKERLESVGYTVPHIAPPELTPTPNATTRANSFNEKRELSQTQITMDNPAVSATVKPNSNSKSIPVVLPKNKVRTIRSQQSGSLEPFLVPRSGPFSQYTQQSVDSQNGASSQEDSATKRPPSAVDEPASPQDVTCPLHGDGAKDLTVPGAFASVAARCNCPKKRKLDLSQKDDAYKTGLPVRLAPCAINNSVAAGGRALRLQRLPPTPCLYTSIQQLRKRTISKCRDDDWEKKLRGACFVGTVSHHRSLIQCGEELVLMNHFTCAQELFYQLALNRFGGDCGVAKIPCKSEKGTLGGIDIEAVISNFVQMEELLHQPTLNMDDVSAWSLPLKISDTNQALAKQATACLFQHADMLLEYYSIQIEKDVVTGITRLTGLPILIEGFEPSPHGLPLFLLRLASEVDWSEEKPCFHGICRELGSYYAQLPANCTPDDHTARVQHVMFPAITILLIPTKDMKKNDFVTLTSLPKLFRVFERC